MRNKKRTLPVENGSVLFWANKLWRSYPVQICVENTDCGYPPDEVIISCA